MQFSINFWDNQAVLNISMPPKKSHKDQPTTIQSPLGSSFGEWSQPSDGAICDSGNAEGSVRSDRSTRNWSRHPDIFGSKERFECQYWTMIDTSKRGPGDLFQLDRVIFYSELDDLCNFRTIASHKFYLKFIIIGRHRREAFSGLRTRAKSTRFQYLVK